MPNFYELEHGTGYLLLEHGNGYLLLEQGLFTKQQIIDAAVQIAGGVAGDVQMSPLADSEMTAEDLFPLAVRFACQQMVKEGNLQDVGRTFDIRLTESNNWFSGALPENMLTDYLDMTFQPDFPYSSMSANFQDFQRQKFSNLLSYWVVHNNMFYTTSPSTGSTNINLYAPGLPEIPIDPNEGIDMTTDLKDRIVNLLAMALRNEVKLIG